MFMSENTCALVDLVDKAVAEGARPNTENEVTTLPRDRNIDTQIETYRNPATIASLWSEGLTGPADQLPVIYEAKCVRQYAVVFQ